MLSQVIIRRKFNQISLLKLNSLTRSVMTNCLPLLGLTKAQSAFLTVNSVSTAGLLSVKVYFHIYSAIMPTVGLVSRKEEERLHRRRMFIHTDEDLWF